MSPSERYQADLRQPDFIHDSAQALAVRHLQRLFDDLLQPVLPAAKPSFWQKLIGQEPEPAAAITGLYFGAAWGAVKLI